MLMTVFHGKCALKNSFLLVSVSLCLLMPSKSHGQESETSGNTGGDSPYEVLKQKACLILMKTPAKLKVGSSLSFKFEDEKVRKGTVKKSGDNKAQILFQTKPGETCPDWTGETPEAIKSESVKPEGSGNDETKENAEAESAEETSKPNPSPAPTETSNKKQKDKRKAKKQSKKASSEGESAEAENKTKPTENKKEYRIDAGGGYLVFMQTIAAADPFNFDAKKETIGSIGAFAYFAGLQASIPLSSGNNFLLGGRYQAWSANKIVELGGGSPSFKYALKITELVLKPGYEWPTCFGLGFYCALTGVVGKSNSSDVRLGAVQKPPLSTLEYTRFGGGSLLKSKFSDGFFGYVELEGSSSMGTLIRGDTEKTFSITPGLFVVNGGINLSL